MAILRARMVVKKIEKCGGSEVLTIAAVEKAEDIKASKDYAQLVNSADLEILITDPELFGTFTEGAVYFIDLSPSYRL